MSHRKQNSSPRKNARCSNCGTDRYPVRAKGLCKRCYPLELTIEHIKGWNANDPKSFKGYPASLPPPQSEHVPRMQADVIEQFRRRLEFLRHREHSLSEPVDSIKIEFQLQRLAKNAGARNATSITHGLASVFDNFGPEHSVTLYRILNTIEENIPWRGIRWSRYLEMVNEDGKGHQDFS